MITKIRTNEISFLICCLFIIYLINLSNGSSKSTKRFLFRFWGAKEMVHKATEHSRRSIQEILERRDESRRDLCLVYDSREMKYMHKEELGPKVMEKIGAPVLPLSKCNRDLIQTKKFLNNTSASYLPKIDDLDLRTYLPHRSAIIHTLFLQKQKSDNYHIPSTTMLQTLIHNTGIENDDIEKVNALEVTLGVTNHNDCRRVMIWADENQLNSQKNFPSGLMPMETEYIKIPNLQYPNLIKTAKNWDSNPEPLIFKIPDTNDTDCRRIPARIMLGDGLTWVLSIRFKWEIVLSKDNVRYYKLSPVPIKENDAVLSSLCTYNAFVGHDVINQRNDIQCLFLDVFGIDVELADCIEIEAIAVANGWMLKTDKFTTNFITMGNVINPEKIDADGTWCLPWAALADEFKVCCIGNVRVSYTNSTVLLSALVKNIFPDLNVFCGTLELIESQAIEWFNNLVIHCLKETTINHNIRPDVKTRRELIKNLCIWTSREEGRRQRSAPSSKVKLFSQLVPDWSTVAYGGARYLHSVGSFFVNQYSTIKQIEFSHGVLIANTGKDIDDKFIDSCTFGRGIDTGRTYQPIREEGLHCNPEFKSEVVKFDLSKLKNTDLAMAMLSQGSQTKVQCILECARLNREFLIGLFCALSNLDLDNPDYSFWIQKTSLYEKLRNMKFFTTGVPPPAVKQIESEILRHQQNVTQLEEKTRKKDEQIVANRKMREELYSVKKSRARFGVRGGTGLQQEVYGQVPGDHTARNQKKKRYRKRYMAVIRQLDDYVHEDQWRSLKRVRQEPTRATSYNVRATGLDLRDVLHHKHSKERIKQAQGSPGRQDQIHVESARAQSRECTRNSSAQPEEFPTDHVRYRSPDKEMIPSRRVYMEPRQHSPDRIVTIHPVSPSQYENSYPINTSGGGGWRDDEEYNRYPAALDDHREMQYGGRTNRAENKSDCWWD